MTVQPPAPTSLPGGKSPAPIKYETECKPEMHKNFGSNKTLRYRGAHKSLARPRRKQAQKHVRDARDFNNIETRAVIKFSFFPARQGAEGNSRHTDRNISFFPSWSG